MPIAPPSFRRIDKNMNRAETERCAFGEVAFFSSPSPGHPDHNDDSAAFLLSSDWGVLAVSDGAGGTAGGGKASATVVEILQQAVPASLPVGEVRAALLDAIEAADARIRETVPGALATIAAVVVEAGAARAISVGDSLCVVVGGRGKLKYRSIAHGPTGFAEEAGMLDEEEAIVHEERHFVSNMLGLAGMRVEVGVPLKLAPRDTVLVACDALFDNLRLEEIGDLARLRPLSAAVDALVALTGERMRGEGPLSHQDDLTILAFRPV